MHYLMKNLILYCRVAAKWISSILAALIIVFTSPLWIMPYLVFHICDIVEDFR